MNRPVSLLLGAVAVVLFSLMGLVVVPGWQLGVPAPRQLIDEGGAELSYPLPYEDDAFLGREVYRAEGCIYCHSQQVRPEAAGSDLARGYGERRSVPLDYIFDSPPLLGTMRTGPDLANIGVRQPSATWHHLHLYDARIVSPGSIMPPLRYLYEVVEQDPGVRGYALPESYLQRKAWIVPTAEARQLVAYLEALHQDHALGQVQ